MTRGIFVVLDGPDGSGKTTQRIQVFTKLMKLGLKVVTTAEPGATRIGKAIKKLILNKANKISVETETCLFLADRIAHLQNFVYPELEKNDVVICDRYTPSTVVYQSLVKGFSFEDLSQLNKILKIPEADLTFIFKVSEADQTRRLHQFRTELDMYEDDPEFRKQVISAFNELADRNNYEVVDGSLDRDVITEQIVERILLERNK